MRVQIKEQFSRKSTRVGWINATFIESSDEVQKVVACVCR
jgi:hypothetical protein